jgi:hypothetical protein
MTQIASLPLVENLNNTLIVPVVDVSDGNKTKRLTISSLATLAKGVQGVQGLFGPQGPANGPQGSTGSQGTAGSQGIQGTRGVQGIRGAQGVQGTQGTQGTQGAQGIQGIIGVQGRQGGQGISGTNAGQGATGGQGTTGSQGIQGPLARIPSSVTSATNAIYAITVAYDNSSTSIATTEFVGKSVPKGVIWMWNSIAATIPTGFQLCDGTNGTPNLLNQFIVGAGDAYVVGDRGGSADAIVVAHSHTLADPGHKHFNGPDAQSGQGSTTGGGFAAITQSGAGNTVQTSSSLTGITMENFGVSGTNANLPPYYALCYIQKMF